MPNGNQNGSNRIVAYVFAIIFAIGFAIVLAQALVLPLFILSFVFLAFALYTKSEDLFIITIILFLATAVAFVIGFVLGGTDFGKLTVSFFNITTLPIRQ
jgi:hypothetical protein